MRKTIVAQDARAKMAQRSWLDLEQLAQVEVTSEEAAHPIEAALLGDEQRDGWRASERGMQTIRLREIDEYTVDLREVSILDLQIRPDISDREARASLSAWRVA